MTFVSVEAAMVRIGWAGSTTTLITMLPKGLAKAALLAEAARPNCWHKTRCRTECANFKSRKVRTVGVGNRIHHVVITIFIAAHST